MLITPRPPSPDRVPARQLAHHLPLEVAFPDAVASVAAMRECLERLDPGEALLVISKLNLTVSGYSDAGHKERQERCLHALLSSEQIEAVNAWVKENGGADKCLVFFRAQLLEAMRWASLFCPSVGLRTQ